MKFTRKGKGFTLIELLVVVIIVAVLAAIGVPMLSANVARARSSEAEAGLGTIRTAMRAWFAENGNYNGATTPAIIGLRTTSTNPIGGDLDGRFFDDDAYTIAIAASGIEFCATANGGVGNLAPRADQVSTLVLTMDESGNIGTGCAGGNANVTGCSNCQAPAGP